MSQQPQQTSLQGDVISLLLQLFTIVGATAAIINSLNKRFDEVREKIVLLEKADITSNGNQSLILEKLDNREAESGLVHDQLFQRVDTLEKKVDNLQGAVNNVIKEQNKGTRNA